MNGASDEVCQELLNILDILYFSFVRGIRHSYGTFILRYVRDNQIGGGVPIPGGREPNVRY